MQRYFVNHPLLLPPTHTPPFQGTQSITVRDHGVTVSSSSSGDQTFARLHYWLVAMAFWPSQIPHPSHWGTVLGRCQICPALGDLTGWERDRLPSSNWVHHLVMTENGSIPAGRVKRTTCQEQLKCVIVAVQETRKLEKRSTKNRSVIGTNSIIIISSSRNICSDKCGNDRNVQVAVLENKSTSNNHRYKRKQKGYRCKVSTSSSFLLSLEASAVL